MQAVGPALADRHQLGRTLDALESNQPAAESLDHLHAASDALAAAEQLGDSRLVSRAELAIARHLNARALWEQEQNHAEAALRAADRAGDRGLQMRAQLMLAGLQVRRGELAPAQARLMQTLNAAEQVEDHWVQVRALLSLSSAAGRSGDLDTARELIDRGLALADQHGLAELQVRLLINSMHVARLQGDLERAERELPQALAIKVEPTNLELEQTLMLVQLAMHSPDPGAAVDQARALAEQAKAAGNPHLQGFALAAQGRAECRRAPSVEAVALFEQAAMLYQNLDLPDERANVLNEGAACLHEQGRFEPAYEMLLLAQGSEREAVERRRTEAAASLNVAYQSEQRQRQLVQAELAAERLQGEIATQQRDRLRWTALALLAMAVAGWFWFRVRARDARLSAVEEAQQARIDLLALTSHEIRNPAHGLISALAALRSQATDADSERLLRSAAQAAGLITRLATDTLDLSLIEQGRLAVERAPASPAELLEEAIELERAAAEDKGLRLSSEVEFEATLRTMLDRQRISQVLLNLLSNAIRYSDGGTVSVRSWVESQPQRRWCVEVRDAGPGLADDELERVFDPYFRGSAARGSGGGLGLTVTRRIVEAHDGQISVRNGAEGGAVFGFTLPLVDPPATEGEAAHSPARSLHGLRLLVIDDDEFVRSGARLIAESAGMKVRELPGPTDLFAEIRAFAPDALLCDRHLDQADGLELLASVRSIHPGGKPKLILMTGDHPPPTPTAPLDGVLGKPFSVEQLAAILTD